MLRCMYFKIKKKGSGQHTDCDVCFIDEIKDIKKSKLKENIIILEKYSKTIELPLNELKNIFKKMNEDKEELKKKIFQLFTKIRTALNEREDEIYKIIDDKFDTLYFKENLIKQGDKLPNEIKQSLEQGKLIGNEKNEIDKLNKFINDCVNIEKNIENIEIIKQNIEECNSKEIKINFIPEKEDEINGFINTIKCFGKLNEEIKKKEENILENKVENILENKEVNILENKVENILENKEENIFENKEKTF